MTRAVLSRRSRDTSETRLIGLARVWSLLDLDHFYFFQDLEAMTASGKQYNIPSFEDSTLQIILPVVININTQLTAFQEQHFLREIYLSRDRVVDVRLNNLPRGMAHIG